MTKLPISSAVSPRSRYQVSVELRHQAISYPYLRDLAELSDDPVISRFLNLYDAVRPGSELIAALVFEVGMIFSWPANLQRAVVQFAA